MGLGRRAWKVRGGALLVVSCDVGKGIMTTAEKGAYGCFGELDFGNWVWIFIW